MTDRANLPHPPTLIDVDELTRRRLLTGGAAAGLLIAAGRGVQPADGAQPETAAFPVTIEHRYGSTTIPEEPKRVVAIGSTDLDALLALGVVPVATGKSLGNPPGTVFPWFQDELGDGPLPEVLNIYTDGIPFERVAALRPDLVLAVYSAIERADYDKLSQIAPTVAQPKEHVDYGAPWQLMTRTVGRAVGQAEQAERLVADVEAQIAQARAAHPEFAGATGVLAGDFGDGTYSYWPPPDQAGRFLAALGFEVPAGLAELPLVASTRGQISAERAELLDADVLLWYYAGDESGPAKIRANPLYARLDVATQGRDIFLYDSGVFNQAISDSSVLSIPFLLEHLVPLLAAAVDGDPATTAQAAS